MDFTNRGPRQRRRSGAPLKLGTTLDAAPGATLAGVAVTALMAGGCVPREHGVAATGNVSAQGRAAVAASARRFAPELSDTVWTALVANAESDTPALLATDGRQVYVGDPTSHNVMALDASTGQRRWETRRSTDSTLSQVSPRALFKRRDGGVLVLTSDAGEVVTLASDGHVERRIHIPAPAPIESACELPDHRLLASVLTSNAGLLVVDASGRVGSVHPLPWTDLRQKSGLLSAVVLSPTRDGCLAALAGGRGFTRFDGRQFLPPVPYVERSDLPEVRRIERVSGSTTTVSTFLSERVGAALDLAATNTAIVTSFGGHTDDRNHLVDVYDTDGRYRRSYRTRRSVGALTATDSLLFILTHSAGEPILLAFRWPTPETGAGPVEP